jgi:lysophospholipase L1-like esterase
MDRRDFIVGFGGAALAAGGGALALTSARAEREARSEAPFYIVGDSIGEGLVWASGEQGSTKRGMSTLSEGLLADQIQGRPYGSTLVISLGTNDALAHRDGGAIAKTAAIYLQHIKGPVIWVGPVHAKAFSSWAHHLDLAMSSAVRAGGARYVSAFMLDKLDSHHAKDGVHFDLAGYKLLWEAVRAGV